MGHRAVEGRLVSRVNNKACPVGAGWALCFLAAWCKGREMSAKSPPAELSTGRDQEPPWDLAGDFLAAWAPSRSEIWIPRFLVITA